MAHFDRRELVDLIRHEIRVEDDTGFAAKIIPPAEKRGKYGGLPLNFRHSPSDDEDSNYVGQDYELLHFYEDETRTTRELIEERLRSRTIASEKNSMRIEEPRDPLEFSTLFKPQAINKTIETKESEISKKLDENLESFQNPLNNYRKFDVGSGDNRKCKKILILFPASDQQPECRIEISVSVLAKVFEVIGLCFYKYYEKFGHELGDMKHFNLYTAEDSGEIDTDFPHLERGRAIGDLGFEVLALVKSSDDTINQRKLVVTVYFTSGDKYGIEIPDNLTTISWLIKEALKRRDERVQTVRDDGLPDPVYNIESYEDVGLTFSGDTFVASTNCTSFVVFRKNSSRNDCVPMKPTYLTLNRLSSVMTGNVLGRANSEYGFERDPTTPMSMGGTFFDDDDSVISCFVVHRLHKYRLKYACNLVIRYNYLEISPSSSEADRRKSFLPQQYQKTTRVPWQMLCDVQLVTKDKHKEEVMHILLLSYLQPLSKSRSSTVVSIAEDVDEEPEIGLQSIAHAPRHNYHWKKLQVECKSHEDALDMQQICQRMLAAKSSAALLAFQYSEETLRSPDESARIAMENISDSPLAPTPKSTRSVNTKLRSIARILRRKGRNA